MTAMRVCEDLQRVELGSEVLDANVYGVRRLQRPKVDFLKAYSTPPRLRCCALIPGAQHRCAPVQPEELILGNTSSRLKPVTFLARTPALVGVFHSALVEPRGLTS